MIHCTICQGDREPPHSHCSSCGLLESVGAGICTHHLLDRSDEWSDYNRIMCDGLHRERWAPRLPASDREALTSDEPTPHGEE